MVASLQRTEDAFDLMEDAQILYPETIRISNLEEHLTYTLYADSEPAELWLRVNTPDWATITYDAGRS